MGGQPEPEAQLVTWQARRGGGAPGRGPSSRRPNQKEPDALGQVLSDTCRAEGGREPGSLEVAGVGGDEKHGVGSGAWVQGAHSE